MGTMESQLPQPGLHFLSSLRLQESSQSEGALWDLDRWNWSPPFMAAFAQHTNNRSALMTENMRTLIYSNYTCVPSNSPRQCIWVDTMRTLCYMNMIWVGPAPKTTPVVSRSFKYLQQALWAPVSPSQLIERKDHGFQWGFLDGNDHWLKARCNKTLTIK